MVTPRHPHDLEATLNFLATEKGGKSGVTRSGYRPDHDFGVAGLLFGAHHEFMDVESVAPGASVRSRMWLLEAEAQRERLFPGLAFGVFEGPKKVAEGVIVAVRNPALLSVVHS